MSNQLSCPVCQSAVQVSTLMCYPPKYQAACTNCDWMLQYNERYDSCAVITQSELDETVDVTDETVEIKPTPKKKGKK